MSTGTERTADPAELRRIEDELRATAAEKDEFLAARDIALAEAEATRQRLDFLLEASSLLGASLDFEQTLERLARLAVSGLADVCLIDVLDPSGAVRRMAAAHADPMLQPVADVLRDRYPPDPAGPHPSVDVMKTGRSRFGAFGPESLRATTRDEEHFRLVNELGFRSFICLPLLARGRILGAITLVSTSPERSFDQAEVGLAEDLARRAALAADNARLYGERTRVARALQASLLPRELPDVPGFEVAAGTTPRARATRWAATSTTCSRPTTGDGRSSSATCAGRGPRRRPSPARPTTRSGRRPCGSAVPAGSWTR